MITIPKANPIDPIVEKFLTTFDPNDATTKWTTGLGGAWIRSPLESLEEAGHELPADLIATFAENTRRDWIDRGILRDDFMLPLFDELAPQNDPALGPDKGDNAWDHLHFGGVAVLDDLHARGYLWARDFAFRLVTSYFNNKNTPWMRDAGVAAGYRLYGDDGRARDAGWILLSLLRLRRIAKRANLPIQVAQIEGLLAFHVGKVLEAMPFIEEPQGDSPLGADVEHYRIFMLAILLSALRRCGDLAANTSLWEPISLACDRLTEIIVAARRSTAVYVYDLACDHVGNPFGHTNELTEKNLTKGVAGVGMWLVDALLWSYKSRECVTELVADAKKQGWPTKQPILWACFVAHAAKAVA